MFSVGVDTGKSMLSARLRIPEPGPRYVHLPEWCDAEFLAQLTAEREVKRYQKGVGTVVEWVKVRAWNEDFDLSVYCLAALYILGPSYVATIGANRDTHAPVPPAMREKPPATEKPRPVLPQPRASRSNWVTKGSSWKSRW